MHPLAWCYRHFGHRGLFLALLGTFQYVYGSGLFAAGPPRTEHWWPAASGAIAGFPLAFWGVLWIATGTICWLCAPAKDKRIGFAAGTLLNCLWAAAAIGHWLETGEAGAWAPAGTYVGISVAVLIVSSWPDLPSTPIPDFPDHLPDVPTDAQIARLEDIVSALDNRKDPEARP